jgi:hypothetical protein
MSTGSGCGRVFLATVFTLTTTTTPCCVYHMHEQELSTSDCHADLLTKPAVQVTWSIVVNTLWCVANKVPPLHEVKQSCMKKGGTYELDVQLCAIWVLGGALTRHLRHFVHESATGPVKAIRELARHNKVRRVVAAARTR